MKREDKEFLKELQYEMLTQDTYSQANPRFWTVMQTVRDYDKEDNYDGFCITNYEGELNNDFINWLLSTINGLKDSTGDEYMEYKENLYSIYDLAGLRDLFEAARKDVYISGYKDKEEIVPNTMFLTLKECKNHIKANNYHYDKPHPYSMTAWRSLQVSKLYDILLNTNWGKYLR